MGHLELPHPRNAGLDESHVKHVLSLMPHLQKLEGRNLRGELFFNNSSVFLLIVLTLYIDLPDRIDLGQQFQIFRENELQAWKESGATPEHQSRLIPPSGSLDSTIAHHLHQQSFTTKALANAHTTADKSNGCIAMVMGNGFQEGKTLLFDHLHRQSAKSEGLKTYPETVINAHEDFTRQIMGSSAAKVEIVYGRHVQKRILKIMKCSLLPLWGRFKGIFLVLGT